MAINAAWHLAHKMPRNATHAQRVRWHRAHQKACGCAPVPASLRDDVVTSARAAPRKRAKPRAKARARAGSPR